MTKRRLLGDGVVFLLVAFIVTVAWWLVGRVSQSDQTNTKGMKSPPALTASNGKDKNANQSGHQTTTERMSALEFGTLRVTLPKPVNEPWEGSAFNSRNCFDPGGKEIVEEVLAGWIRLAVAEGRNEMAARYLWSLLKFAEDKDRLVGTKAIFFIYQLGDYEGFALRKMREWITSREGFLSYGARFETSGSMDVRARTLRELSLYDDHRLDDVIYATWEKMRADGAEELDSVDFAYYLEKQGRQLPFDYWMQRLDGPDGFNNALEVVEKIATPQVTAKLETLFQELTAPPQRLVGAERAASIASALFRETGDVGYRDYLIEEVQRQLASTKWENSLQKNFDGSAMTNDTAALEVVATGMKHHNGVIQEMAIGALGKSKNPAAAEILFEAAIEKAKHDKRFPGNELHALLAQNDQSSDAKYERLKQALLAGSIGRTAFANDFDELEFFRKHLRK